MSRPVKIALITAAVVVLLVGGIYGAGMFYFQQHFFPNTTVGDRDISLQSASEFAASVDDDVKNYTLTVEGEGFSYKADAEELGITADGDAMAQAILDSQDVITWPYQCLIDHDATEFETVEYDTKAVKKDLKKAVKAYNVGKSASKDATIVYNSLSGEAEVKKEVYGKQINYDALMELVDADIRSLNPTCEISSKDLIMPTVLSTDERFPAALKKANKLLGGEIKLTLNGSVAAGTITKKDIASWLTTDDNLMPSVKSSKVEAWVEDLSGKLNTVGTQRTWKRADGKKCTSSGGNYGWQVDTSKLASTITKQLKKADFDPIDIPCSKVADVYKGLGKRDWGSYVDIDLKQQHVRYYDKNDKLLYEADCVSGNADGKHDTPCGIYYLNWKSSPQMLVGRNPDNSIAYETEVKYWMPFIASSIGLHDASWKTKFGGEIYKTNGSHGCINLSTKDAKWFYEHLEVGIPVITHK